jgi:Arc/MetJ-type ribon-helix-helix transcriptional regulator
MGVMHMMLNLKLEKFQEDVVNEMVSKGIASNKSEAIRMMIIHYNEHFGLRSMTSDEKAVRKMQSVEKAIAEGRMGTVKWSDVKRKYPHLSDT